MRLSLHEKAALKACLALHEWPTYLFGSRADESRSGGDIDILVLVEGLDGEARYRLSLKMAVTFQAQCDEKIDVVVLDEAAMTPADTDFLRTVRAAAMVDLRAAAF